MVYDLANDLVASYVGAWIETFIIYQPFGKLESHPTWVRGLKRLRYSTKGLIKGRILRGCVD